MKKVLIILCLSTFTITKAKAQTKTTFDETVKYINDLIIENPTIYFRLGNNLESTN